MRNKGISQWCSSVHLIGPAYYARTTDCLMFLTAVHIIEAKVFGVNARLRPA